MESFLEYRFGSHLLIDQIGYQIFCYDKMTKKRWMQRKRMRNLTARLMKRLSPQLRSTKYKSGLQRSKHQDPKDGSCSASSSSPETYGPSPSSSQGDWTKAPFGTQSATSTTSSTCCKSATSTCCTTTAAPKASASTSTMVATGTSSCSESPAQTASTEKQGLHIYKYYYI